jgi:hypothetical protein
MDLCTTKVPASHAVVEILASGTEFDVEFRARAGPAYESLGLRPDQIMVLHYEPLAPHPPSEASSS